MILKFKDSALTDDEDFDYILSSDINIDGDTAIKFFKEAQNDNFDLLIIKCRPDGLKNFSNFILRLSLSIKSRYLIGCINVYSKSAYKFIKDSGNSIINDRVNALNINIDILKNNFKVGYSSVDIGNKARIGLKDYVYLILKRGTILRYSIIGLSGIAVNEGFLFLLHPYLGNILSIIPAIEISIIYNFFMNNRFTFNGHGMFLKRLFKYNIFNLIGYGVNLLIYYFAIFENVSIYIADLLGIIVAFIITYSTASFLVW
ncbi:MULTISPECIES: GtrA family protein [Acidiplasma]|jgi:putative flippase GtrA|uniref:GtrA/DPMS transmembrane domain-containing protein n=3 Tax=Acidiplasma TaxID=507753 RepID=A0A0Q0VJ56_9ARCH|nr:MULTISPECIES: GtrA family protein [Acidiplasma]KJE49751.1 hypothetical protein TZ01_01210 [Acidiplasma sp. MBA-1]KPV46552.1 hypothetical protein SE19_04995 [Acidiplasma aeolicum]KQB33550.1 hypothetical protein AOG55_02615 [Acidiplasma cupricumulans]KQB34759.1 hypothetical protein AOG54_00595 [Acidiplasma aeolicum]WMT55705.1 MAG: GtrA family protein [Acidiplasma sp.]